MPRREGEAPPRDSSNPALVTGAAGFIGGRLALRLRTEGAAVRALVRPSHDVPGLRDAGVTVVKGDAGDPETVARAADGCRVVFHLAAARGPRKLANAAYLEENRRLSEAVGAAALQTGVERVVFTSTATLTGHTGSDRQDESTPARPNSGYRASRLADERVFRAFFERGLDVVTVRVPQRVMGPGAVAWARVARRVRDGEYRILPAGGTIHSGDVDDVVDALLLCASSPGIAGQLFTIGASAPTPLVDVLGWIAADSGVSFEPLLVPGAPFRAYVKAGNLVFRMTHRSLPHHFTAEFFSARFGLSIDKARRELGYRPRFDTRESVRRTVSWLRAESLV